MKREFKLLFDDIEKTFGKKIDWRHDLGKLRSIFRMRNLHVNNLSPEAKDRIALFAGFQNWKDFVEAVHGEDDGQINYETEKQN